MSNIEDLRSDGFEFITHWELHKDTIKLGSFDWSEESAWIYAFVENDLVKYVGKTGGVLRSRMDGYRHQLNDRVGGLIRDSINENNIVEIWGLRRPVVSDKELDEEETALIRKYKPDWNVQKMY